MRANLQLGEGGSSSARLASSTVPDLAGVLCMLINGLVTCALRLGATAAAPV